MVIMKIKLTQGKVAIVDKEDFNSLNKHKWHIFGPKKYAGRDIVKNGKKRKILMHRFIMGEPFEKEVDHINGDVLDNRKENLRICTHQQNCSNHPGYGDYKGVTKVTNRFLEKPYCTRIMVEGKNLYIGYFQTLEEAKAAYDSAAMVLFGEFAKTNFDF
jgi:hypothetical protein